MIVVPDGSPVALKIEDCTPDALRTLGERGYRAATPRRRGWLRFVAQTRVMLPQAPPRAEGATPPTPIGPSRRGEPA